MHVRSPHDRFVRIAHHPVRRVIEVHAQSLRRARRDAACRPLDQGSCRILLNEARREIDRLRRGIDRCEAPGFALSAFAETTACDGGAQRAVPNQMAGRQAPLYAVAPLGLVAMQRDATASVVALPQEPVAVIHHVTNLGTLLDTFA